MAHRATLISLFAIILVGGVAVPSLALAGYRFIAGDGFSSVLGVGIALVVFLIVVIVGISAVRSRR